MKKLKNMFTIQHGMRSKNYFPLPSEIFAFGVHSSVLAIYAYLTKQEDREPQTDVSFTTTDSDTTT